MGALFRRLVFLLRRSRREADLREEIETHRTLRQEQLERSGIPGRAALPASRHALGNVMLAREDVRRVWIASIFEEAWQDLKTVVRRLRKSPSFSLIAIGTLALGMGANTALFSIYNSLLLRTLPVREPGSLVLLDGEWTYPIWEAVRRHQDAVFDGAFAWAGAGFDLSRGGRTDPAAGAYVSGSMFDMLGIQPEHGRLLSVTDDSVGANHAVAVISHRFWQQRFGGAADVVGDTLSLDRVPFTIIGVMPALFNGPDVGRTADIVVPFASEPLIRPGESLLPGRSTWWIRVMGRLRPGQTIEQATTALRGLQPTIREATWPSGSGRVNETYLTEPFVLTPAATGRSELRGRFEAPLLAMIGTVGLVLLIACANIASLLLARALSRHRELSVRLALGASRWRVARLLLAESLVIASAGATLGLLFAIWSSALLVRQLGSWRGEVFLDLTLDWRVMAFTIGLTALTAIVAGLAPAVRVRDLSAGDALRDAGRGIVGDRRFSVRGALVVTQIALSLVLVIGAGLFLRTFNTLSRVPLGFAPDELTVVSLSLNATAVDAPGRLALIERIQTAVTGAPGIASAAMSVVTPITGSGWNGRVGDGGPPDRSRMTWINGVTPRWFRTMAIRVLSGRDFEQSDRLGAARVAIVNETFARRFLPDVSPVGQSVRISGPGGTTSYQVIGLVSDAVYRSLREGMVPTLYLPLAQEDRIGAGITMTVATTPGARSRAERAVAETLRQVDPGLAFTFRNFDEFLRALTTQERLVAMLSAFFGGLALVLAVLGLYGVVSHAVQARRTEIGVRMALGASATGIVRLIFKRVGLLLAIGLILGTSLGLWASRFVQTLLFQLDAQDPITFAGALALLVAAGVLAAWLPARRAARLDPARVLREG